LIAHACQPAFQYCHWWRVGDAVLWDNRRVLHAGTISNMVRETRLMHRTTLQEAVPL
jgi:alpha-ketoglutarate-dependent taurine dioxygenase